MGTKNCQNCKKDFTIDTEDFLFYEKIQVPAPTFCRECRTQRRFAYRNERTLHRRKCSMTGKDIISCFSAESPFTVIDRDLWWTDEWTPFDHAREYDFSRPFFSQFRDLMEKVPMPALFIGKCTNTKYGNHIGEFKNAYLVSASWIGENVMYSSRTNACRDSMDDFAAIECEFAYDCVMCQKCSRIFHSELSVSCVNSYFLYDCRNCTDCFGCANLRNKNYCIYNQQYSKEEYAEKLKEIFDGSEEKYQAAKKKFEEIKRSAIHRFANVVNCQNTTGDNLANIMNSKECFDAAGDIRDSRYLINAVGPCNDVFDGYGVGSHVSLLYEGMDSGVNGSRQLFIATVWDSMDAEYSYNCHGCNHIFGCVGIRKKEYCILNRQYTKEEYMEILPKIKQQMMDMPYVDTKERTYGYGEYFPAELSPFAYNETVANDYFPLSKEETVEEGYTYREPERTQYAITHTAKSLPESIGEATDDMLQAIIECNDCKRAYRILPDELTFLRRFNLSLPRKCFECRHHDRLARTNFPRLYNRTCTCAISGHDHEGLCENTFETTFSPERPEKVYCESCYQKEVV